MTSIITIEVQKFLEGAEYPMERDALIVLAEGNSASEEVLTALENLPDVDFESSIDLQEALWDMTETTKNKGSEESTTRNKNKEQNEQRRSRKKEIEERKRRLKEETGKLTEPGKTIAGEPDHRLKGQETEALKSARHMEHGYDGRGQITDPSMDGRLAENRAKTEGSEEAQQEEDRSARTKRKTWKQLSKK